MNTFCGLDCCDKCPLKGSTCAGCRETDGHPCGGSCCAAERVKADGCEAYAAMRQAVIDEVNALGYEGLHADSVVPLLGAYVNLAYPLPSGAVKLLDDGRVYLGTQVEISGSDRCWGVIADESCLVVCRYGAGVSNPELVLFKKRGV